MYRHMTWGEVVVISNVCAEVVCLYQFDVVGTVLRRKEMLLVLVEDIHTRRRHVRIRCGTADEVGDACDNEQSYWGLVLLSTRIASGQCGSVMQSVGEMWGMGSKL
ncbi:hypothetical protein Tco_0850390 [Tanacetum coccineum]